MRRIVEQLDMIYDSMADPIRDGDGNARDHSMKPWEGVGFYKREREIKLETTDNDKQLIWLLWILQFSYYLVFIWFYYYYLFIFV